MKKKYGSFITVMISALLLSGAAHAALGLKTILAEQGVKAMGQAVLAAAQEAFASSEDPAVVQSALVAILNEAVATGDENAIRYAIVAVMQACGKDHLDVSKAAINASNAFSDYRDLAAKTVTEAQALLEAGGGAGTRGGGTQGGGTQGGGQQGGAEQDQEKQLGGGQDDDRGGGQGRLFLLEIDPEVPFTEGDNLFKGTAPTAPETPDRERPATEV